MYLCEFTVHICGCWILLQLELQVVVSHFMIILEIEPRSLARTSTLIHCWTSSPALTCCFVVNKFLNKFTSLKADFLMPLIYNIKLVHNIFLGWLLSLFWVSGQQCGTHLMGQKPQYKKLDVCPMIYVRSSVIYVRSKSPLICFQRAVSMVFFFIISSVTALFMFF